MDKTGPSRVLIVDDDPAIQKVLGIHVLARIVAIADAFDTMTSTRPYRNVLHLDIALSELSKGRETQFDPRLVGIFLEKEVFSILPAAGAFGS